MKSIPQFDYNKQSKRYHTILLRSSPGDRLNASILSLIDSILLLYAEYRSWKSFLNCAATSFISRCCLIHSYPSPLPLSLTVKLLLFAGGPRLGIAGGGGSMVFVFTGDGFCAGITAGGRT